MNTKNKFVVAALLTCLAVASTSVSASVEDTLANICNIVKSNDKSELRKKMKTVQSDYRLRLADYYDGVTCDGNSLIRTAILSNAVDTGTLLVKKLTKSKLVAPEQDGILLAAWIESNGHNHSPIAALVKARI